MKQANEQMYRICWTWSIVTGETGHGSRTFSLGEAKKIIAQLNENNRYLLQHWVEAVNDNEEEHRDADDTTR